MTGTSTASATARVTADGGVGLSSAEAPAPVFVTLRDGAAEVDVDDVGARRLAHPRGISDRGRVRPEHLDRERMLVARDPQVAERALVAVREPAGGDHLRADEACAEAPSLPAEGLDGDARHRREHDARGNLDVADLERRGEVGRGDSEELSATARVVNARPLDRLPRAS